MWIEKGFSGRVRDDAGRAALVVEIAWVVETNMPDRHSMRLRCGPAQVESVQVESVQMRTVPGRFRMLTVRQRVIGLYAPFTTFI